jgi:DNA-binding transcriptional MerR regulator
MGYTIKTIAQKVGLTEYTLRYYEREGLLPLIERDENGNRNFSDQDMELIGLICCLRNTGMPLAAIKRFVALTKGDAATVGARKQMLIEQKQAIEEQIRQFKKYALKIDKKIAHYEELEKNDGSCRSGEGFGC